MDQQRLDAKKMFKELSFGKKLEHIWYYYKRWIIIPFLILLLIGYSIYEVMTKPKYDLEGTFYSQIYVSEDQLAKMESYFSQFVEDLNGDGKKNIKLYSASVAMLNNDVEGSMVVNTKLSAEMAAGVGSFILVDSTFHKIISQEAYELSIETPRELTSLPEFSNVFEPPTEVKVYWITRALYTGEKNDSEAILLHDATKKVENSIFHSLAK